MPLKHQKKQDAIIENNMEIIEIKLDQSTIPQHNQKVRWQNLNDYSENVWKEGVYDADEEIFCVGNEDEVSDFDSVWQVARWQATVCGFMLWQARSRKLQNVSSHSIKPLVISR